MTKRQRRKQLPPRASASRASFDQERALSLSIQRKLDPEQEAQIMTDVGKVATAVCGFRIIGSPGERQPGQMIITAGESRNLDFLRLYTAEQLNETILDAVPQLESPKTSTVFNIGKLGGKYSVSVTIAAALMEDRPPEVNERGELEAVLCELNGWNPVNLPKINIPHISLGHLPNNTDVSQIQDLKEAVSEVIPSGLVISLQPADIRISI